jgi:hypothetical protein
MNLPFAPMLAVKAEPFDSPEHLFEVKGDGVRALAGRDAGGGRLGAATWPTTARATPSWPPWRRCPPARPWTGRSSCSPAACRTGTPCWPGTPAPARGRPSAAARRGR